MLICSAEIQKLNHTVTDLASGKGYWFTSDFLSCHIVRVRIRVRVIVDIYAELCRPTAVHGYDMVLNGAWGFSVVPQACTESEYWTIGMNRTCVQYCNIMQYSFQHGPLVALNSCCLLAGGPEEDDLSDDCPGKDSDSGSARSSGSVLTSRISQEAKEDDSDNASSDSEPYAESEDSDGSSLPDAPSFLEPVKTYWEGANLSPQQFQPPNGRDKFLSSFWFQVF